MGNQLKNKRHMKSIAAATFIAGATALNLNVAEPVNWMDHTTWMDASKVQNTMEMYVKEPFDGQIGQAQENAQALSEAIHEAKLRIAEIYEQRTADWGEFFDHAGDLVNGLEADLRTNDDWIPDPA